MPLNFGLWTSLWEQLFETLEPRKLEQDGEDSNSLSTAKLFGLDQDLKLR